MKSLVCTVVNDKASRALLLGLTVACAAALASTPVAALELVPGGYGADWGSSSLASPHADGRLDLRSEGFAGVSLDFTPRHGAGLLTGAPGEPGPQLDLVVRGGSPALDRLGLGAEASALHPGGRRKSGTSLIVGGAMHWADWTLGGGIGRADFLGTDVDVLSATVGYGRLNAEISFGQSTDYQSAPSDVLMLSTDLAAWSWLTLESDLAVGSTPSADRQDESVAVGRFGLRLNF